jgi:hypothetical protein
MTTENESKSAARSRDNDTARGEATLANRAHEVADDARQATLDRVESARASAQAAKDRAVDGVRKFGGTVRKVGEHLRVEEQYYIAEKANDASQRLDNIATYLNAADLGTLMRDTRTLARRNPGWFYGGAFVLGLAAGRFLKGGVESLASGSQSTQAGTGPRLPTGSRSAGGPSEVSRGTAQRGQDRPAPQAASSSRANPLPRGASQ